MSSMGNFVKNYTKGYSDAQTKVREATSNDAWGPSGAMMNQIAQMTFNQVDFVEVMEMLDKRLNDKGKNWRHVYKALIVVEYCLSDGSDNVVNYFKKNIYLIKTLREFQYIDEDMKDQGANVRQKAKDLSNLLADISGLDSQRKLRSNMKNRMASDDAQDSGYDSGGRDRDRDAERDRRDRDRNRPSSSTGSSSRRPPPRRTKTSDEDDYADAMAASKASAAEDDRNRAKKSKEDDDMARAIALSRAEDERKKKELEDANARALFDDQNQFFMNNAYTGQKQLDFYGNPLVPMQTGYMQTGFGQQQTGFNYQQQQQNDQYQQQQQMMLMEQQRLAQEQEAARLQAEYQAMLLQQQQQQQQQQWLLQQQQQQQQQQHQQQLQAQSTGFRSNNPFAFPSNTPPPPMPAAPTPPPAPVSDYDRRSSPAPLRTQPTAAPQLKDNGQFSKLNDLLSSREGVDTFGNVGALRIPMGTGFHGYKKPSGSGSTGQQQQQGSFY